MSCQLKTIAALADNAAIKHFLYPNSTLKNSTESSNYHELIYTNHEDYNPNTEQLLDHSWLQDCLISFSPTSDFLVLATSERIMFLALKWDNHEEKEIKAKFIVHWESVVFNENCEEISSVLCVPLVSQKRTSQGSPDWTCIIVGFTSGYVKMYTETGVQLFSQIFHDGPVIKLNCRTYEPPRHNKTTEQHEELVILYPWALVTIDGFSLYQTLRACRNQVAKATASGVDATNPPPLAYKKWGVQEQHKINDCHNVGVIPSNTFDHLQTASLLGGFTAIPRNTVPVASLMLATGQNPYLAFYYAMEGSSPPLMSEVATAVVSKVKSYFISAASGIFGINSKPDLSHQPKPKIEPATPLACRFALPDIRRNGDNIIISPNKALGVITDSFGRVILIDTHLGTAIRMWKGYRDAQCGWLEVIEDTHQQDKEKVTPVPRIALFLVIYAPRRGLLEVWTAQQGPRVAAFNVSKWARLVFPGYSMMGLNSVSSSQKKISSAQCFLIDPEGPVKQILIPFHYALSDKNSKRAQSLHLLRKLKIALKESTEQNDQLITSIMKIVGDISTPSIKQQALETLSRNKKTSFSLMEAVTSMILDQTQMQEFDMLDFETKLLLQNTQRLKQLLQLYDVASSANNKSQTATGTFLNLKEMPIKLLSEVLVLPENETEQAMVLLHQHQHIIKTKAVCFSDEKNPTISFFLSCFHVYVHHLNKDPTADFKRLPVDFNPTITKEEMVIVGCFLFKSSLQGLGSLEELQRSLVESGLLAEKILILLIEFCLSTTFWLISWDCILNYSAAIKFISHFADTQLMTVSCNEVSSWWQNIRSILTQSSNPPLAYISAVVSRGVALSFASNIPELKDNQNCCSDDKVELKNKSNDSETNPSSDNMLTEWESISMEALQWNILVKQLEDLMILSSLLNFQLNEFVHSDYNNRHLSLNSLSEKGRGIVSELVSEWLIRSSADGHLLKKQLNDDKDDKTEEAKEAIQELHNEAIFKANDLLQTVQKRFPFSLNPEMLTINCSWEHAAYWNKEPDNIMHLQKALWNLQMISNAILKHGVASMIWHMLVAKRFTNAALLIEKVGKPPKERLCRRDIGISDTVLEKFLNGCVNLLDILMEANLACHAEDLPSFSYEDFWQHRQGPTPLIEVAASQKNTNYELICHHYQLALAMHFIILFGIKNHRPISFYDTKGKSAFFKELHTFPPIPVHDIDLSVTNARTRFLCRVISAAVESIPEPIPEGSQSENCPLPAVRGDSCNMSHWIGQVMDLAKLWDLDTDVLRRHHVCELYSRGLDSLAEEILPAVSDTVIMGSQLILLAGQRIYIAIKQKFSSVEAYSRLSPNLTTWLKTLDQTSLHNPSPPLTMTATLIRHVINHLPEGHSEYQMALALVDAVQSLTDLRADPARVVGTS